MAAPVQLTAKKRLATPTAAEVALAEDIGSFFDDPEGFVRYVFPWGEKGTSLHDEDGPDVWQCEIMGEIRAAIRSGTDAQAAIQIAVASGHGIGKTGLVAWLILWFMSTRDFPQVVVTANTSTQLSTKTWRELSKWHKLTIHRDWFDWTATRFSHVLYPETWFAAAIPWTEHNSEAFAGTHEKHVLVVFDEASAIADKIWEVTEGAMTTTGAMWLAFGNPTQNSGRFAQCFGKLKHRWITRQVDSRTAKMANKVQIQKWIDDYGEDHDFVRVRVRGVFPRAGSLQFISYETVSSAMRRKASDYQAFARVMGVDVARHGDDQSVIAKRQGNHVHPLQRERISDLMTLADVVAIQIIEFKPDAVFIDATGMGWGVIDRLRQLGHGQKVIGVQVGEKATNDKLYVNKRAELWGNAKEWLEGGGCLPNDAELESEYTGPQYGYDNKMKIVIESKKDMKARQLPSPDGADAINLTLTSPVAPMTTQPNSSWRDRLATMSNNQHRGSAQAA